MSVMCIVHTTQHLNPKRTVVMRSCWLLSLCWEQWLRIQACRELNLLYYCFGAQWFSGTVDDYRKQGARSNPQSCKHKNNVIETCLSFAFWFYWFMNMFTKIWSSLEGGQGYRRGFISVDKNAGAACVVQVRNLQIQPNCHLRHANLETA